jgi:hypothetical protein
MLNVFMLENDMIHVLVVKPRRGVESTGRWWSVAKPLLCVVQGKKSAKGTTDKRGKHICHPFRVLLLAMT